MYSNFLLSSVEQPSMNESKEWLNRLDLVIDKNLSNLNLKNEMLAKELDISERQLFRKVKKLTMLTPHKYILRHRLRKSMVSLKSGIHRTVKEAAFAVGYIKASTYSSHFKKEYGLSPLRVLIESGWR